MFGRTVTNLPEEFFFWLFSIGGLPLRVSSGFSLAHRIAFAEASNTDCSRRKLRRSCSLARKIVTLTVRKLPFQCARDPGVTHLFVVAQHERHLLFPGSRINCFPTSRCSSLHRTWESDEGVEWSGTSIRSVRPGRHLSRVFFCRSLSMQCRPVTFDPNGGQTTPHLLSPGLCAASKRPLPPHPRCLPAAERNSGRSAKHGDSASYRLCLMLRGRLLEAGSAPRRAVFLP